MQSHTKPRGILRNHNTTVWYDSYLRKGMVGVIMQHKGPTTTAAIIDAALNDRNLWVKCDALGALETLKKKGDQAAQEAWTEIQSRGYGSSRSGFSGLFAIYCANGSTEACLQ